MATSGAIPGGYKRTSG